MKTASRQLPVLTRLELGRIDELRAHHGYFWLDLSAPSPGDLELLGAVFGFHPLAPDAHDCFRDVYDHLLRISELIDAQRDVLSSAMDVYLSTSSNHLNLIMKRLTLIATVFLPLTVVTGFFGQDFGWLVDRMHSLAAFLVLGIGGLELPLAMLMVLFKRAGYLR
jgi:magnesium transporter